MNQSKKWGPGVGRREGGFRNSYVAPVLVGLEAMPLPSALVFGPNQVSQRSTVIVMYRSPAIEPS